MGRRNRGNKPRKKNRERGGRKTREEKESEAAMAVNKVHALFIKMEEQFKGCTIAGVAMDGNSGAVCIHVEEHNKVLMFYANDFAIAEHAGKLSDMLMAAGFLVPEAVMETWNQDFTDMATTYSKAVMAGTEETPEGVDPDLIQTILGPYYKPEEAAEELERLTKKPEDEEAEEPELTLEPVEASEEEPEVDVSAVVNGETSTDFAPLEAPSEA